MGAEQLKTVTPVEAFEIINDNPRCVFIDIRSSMEYLFVGHPVGAVHLPWIDEPDWEINPNFIPEVRKLILGGVSAADDNSAPVILICRSGKRSHQAGMVLVEAGLNNIYHIDEGFEGELDDNHQRSVVGGWRFHKLPWEQC